jgi:hypothetical protein
MDEDYQKIIDTYRRSGVDKKSTHYARFREIGELKYSIPAALKNLPWLNKIYIVTNGQTPPASILSLPKVEHVTHQDIFKYSSHLPAFNYHAIESNLCFIPGLSEYFINTNDDFFVGKPLDKDYFLGKSGVGTFMHTSLELHTTIPEKNIWNKNLSNTNDVLSAKYGSYIRNLFPHSPQLFRKSYLEKTWGQFEERIVTTSSNKFRSPSDSLIRILYSYLVMYEKWGVSDFQQLQEKSDGDVFLVKPNCLDYVAIIETGDKLDTQLDKITTNRPDFFCLNDAIKVNQFEDMKYVVTEFLENYYK